MRINAVNMVIGAGVGLADELGEKFDGDRGNVNVFSGVTDWGRVGITVAAYAGQAMNFQPEICKTLAQSTIPLATKTVVKAIVGYTSGMGRAAAHPKVNRATSTQAGGKVAWRPIPIH